MNSAINLVVFIFLTVLCGCSSSSSESQDRKNDLGTGSDGGADTDVDSDTDGDADAGGDSDSDGGRPSEYKWRKVFDTPQGLAAIWGSANNDVYVVGEAGVIVHYDGYQWTEVEHPEVSDLNDIWANSASDIYAVGGYSQNNIEPHYSVGEILHYDGSSWSKIECSETGEFIAAWGSGSTDIFFLSNEATLTPGAATNRIVHYDGYECSIVFTISYDFLYDIWGTSSDNIYAIGSAIFHYNGESWSRVDTGLEFDSIMQMWGLSFEQIYLIGIVMNDISDQEYLNQLYSFNGISWSVNDKKIMDKGNNILHYIWGTASDDIYLVGNKIQGHDLYDGFIYYYNGIDFCLMEIECSCVLGGLWAASKSEAFTVGRELTSNKGIILHYSRE